MIRNATPFSSLIKIAGADWPRAAVGMDAIAAACTLRLLGLVQPELLPGFLAGGDGGRVRAASRRA